MAINVSREWLIAYDIRDPRRLVRLHRFLKKVAVPVQYSVFAAHDTPAHIGRLAGQIEGYIHAKQDDVRIYPLPQKPELFLLGRQIVGADGAMLTAGDLISALTRMKHDGGSDE